METRLAIENRHSRRIFQKKPVEWEKLVKVLNAARLAPSAVNVQPWHFVVVQDPERIKSIVSTEQIFNKWMKKAPVLIIACVNEGKFSLIDLGLSIENLLIMATDLGLGTTPAAVSNKGKLGEIINCPKEFTPTITIALGYVPEKKSFSEKMIKAVLKKKKPLEQIASKEQFGKSITGKNTETNSPGESVKEKGSTKWITLGINSYAKSLRGQAFNEEFCSLFREQAIWEIGKYKGKSDEEIQNMLHNLVGQIKAAFKKKGKPSK